MRSESELANSTNRAVREACVWSLLFLISAGLGYPTLKRYDPRTAVPDAAMYAQMAVSGSSSVYTHLRFRLLVPYLAGAVYVLARNHTGSWDPMMFSFLAVNAFFVATTAYLLFRVGLTLAHDGAVALLAAALYLLNFAIANLHLAALVDGAEACLLLAVIASIFYQRWPLLPLLGGIGAASKESFVPFSIVMAVAWWLAEHTRNRRAALWIAIMAVAEIATLGTIQSGVAGHVVPLFAFVSSMKSPTGYLENLWNSLVDRNSWYILIWLLPLGLAGMKPMPRAWKAAVTAGVSVAILLNAYHSTVGGGGGGLGRYVFNIAGPLLSLSAVQMLVEWYAHKPAP